MQINFTQASGLIAFVPATLAMLAAAWSKERADTRLWLTLAGLNASMTAEIVLSLRHELSSCVGAWLQTEGVYPERRPAQMILAATASLTVLFATASLARRTSNCPQRVAVVATAAAVLLFLLEVISLHATDAVLYRSAGPILLIGWLWLATGWTAAGAAVGSRRKMLRGQESTD